MGIIRFTLQSEVGQNIVRNLKGLSPDLEKYYTDQELLDEYQDWLDADSEFVLYMLYEKGTE